MYETLKTKLINRQMIDSTKKCCGNPLMLQCSILICYCIIGQFFDNFIMNELPSHPLMIQYLVSNFKSAYDIRENAK